MSLPGAAVKITIAGSARAPVVPCLLAPLPHCRWNASLAWFFFYVVFPAEVLKHSISERSMARTETAATSLKDGAFSEMEM